MNIDLLYCSLYVRSFRPVNIDSFEWRSTRRYFLCLCAFQLLDRLRFSLFRSDWDWEHGIWIAYAATKSTLVESLYSNITYLIYLEYFTCSPITWNVLQIVWPALKIWSFVFQSTQKLPKSSWLKLLAVLKINVVRELRGTKPSSNQQILPNAKRIHNDCMTVGLSWGFLQHIIFRTLPLRIRFCSFFYVWY